MATARKGVILKLLATLTSAPRANEVFTTVISPFLAALSNDRSSFVAAWLASAAANINN